MVEVRGRLASMPVNYVSRSSGRGLMRSYLRFACTLLHISTLKYPIELEAAILVDRRKRVQIEMRVANSTGR